MVKLKPILLFIMLLCGGVTVAQDIHFTQYMFSPLNLNPGYTGRFDGDYRIVGNYRSQWFSIMSTSQFETFSLSYDQNIDVYGQTLSAGLVFAHDRNTVGVLQQNKLELSAAFNKNLGGHYLGLGFQLGMLHKGVDHTKYSYPNQYDNKLGGFNTSISNQENFIKRNMYLFDLNAGLVYGKKITDQVYPELGVAVHHITQPKETFLGQDNNLPSRYVGDLKINYKYSEKVKIIPNILFMYQNQAQDLLFGGLVRYKLEENNYNLTQIFGGAAFRNGINRNFDSFEMIVGANISDFQVGMSYDVNISDLSDLSNYRGAIEFSVIYVAKSAEPKIFIVPCDIY